MQVLRIIIFLLLARLLLFDVTSSADWDAWLTWITLVLDAVFAVIIAVDCVTNWGRPEAVVSCNEDSSIQLCDCPPGDRRLHG
jgi:hypothetical protein